MSTMTKAQLCAIIVETSAFYGWRTVKRINRWFNKNHCEIVGHDAKAARKTVRESVKELEAYRDEKIKELMRLRKDDLERMIKLKSKRRVEQRYGGGERIKESELPKIDLGDESRKIIVDRKEITKWVRSAKRRTKKKVNKPLTVIRPKKKRRNRVRINDYLTNMVQFNSAMKPIVKFKGCEA